MKIGVMSDSHDNLATIREALARFKEAGVERVLHGGDVVSPFCYLPFKEFALPFTAVFGNNDGEWLMLDKLAGNFQGEIKKGPILLELGGRRIALMHEPVLIDALADSGHFDLIIYGHTHDLEQRKRGQAIILNPGECCGYLRKKATAVICDLEDMSMQTLQLGVK